MEKEIRQKSSKSLIVLVIILIIAVIGLTGYIVVNKVDNYSINTESNSSNDKNTSENSKNSYSIFAKNLKAGIAKLQNESNINYYNSQYIKSACVEGGYQVNLNNKGELYISYNVETGSYKIASNVLSFTVLAIGNGGCNSLFFIKEDGTVSSANVESTPTVADNGTLKITDNIGDFKNIIDIVGGNQNDQYSGGAVPLFIDIDGNIFYQ